jgi:hypothetical protein
MKRAMRCAVVLMVLLTTLAVISCGGGSSSDPADSDPMMWTWMSGSDAAYSPGVYGPLLFSVPGARQWSVSWTDSAGNLWLFGGYGYDRSGGLGRLNDLWRFDGTYWTWMSGSDVINQNGYYGTMGSPDAANVPGARDYSVSWTDNDSSLWLFGGYGYPGSGGRGSLNDLWRFGP